MMKVKIENHCVNFGLWVMYLNSVLLTSACSRDHPTLESSKMIPTYQLIVAKISDPSDLWSKDHLDKNCPFSETIFNFINGILKKLKKFENSFKFFSQIISASAFSIPVLNKTYPKNWKFHRAEFHRVCFKINIFCFNAMCSHLRNYYYFFKKKWPT